MSRNELIAAIVSGLLVNKLEDWCPRLARRLVRWSAAVKHHNDPMRAQDRADELT